MIYFCLLFTKYNMKYFETLYRKTVPPVCKLTVAWWLALAPHSNGSAIGRVSNLPVPSPGSIDMYGKLTGDTHKDKRLR